jgi:hypothetical protein
MARLMFEVGTPSSRAALANPPRSTTRTNTARSSKLSSAIAAEYRALPAGNFAVIDGP